MAWSSAALSAYETAQLALDKPLIAAQVIPVSPDYAKWIEEQQDVGAGTLASWTDRSATASPARFAYDGYPGYITKQSGTSDDIWYYCLDLGGLVAFDCAFLIGHNAGTIAVDNDVVIQVADDNAFNTNLQEVGNFGTPTPTDDDRLADLTLNVGGDPHRITAQYVRVKFDGPGNITPEIGELVLGRRRQLQYKPDRPFDEYALSEDSDTVLTAGGITHKAVYSRRGFELSGKFMIDSDTYRNDMIAFFRQCRGPFVWVDNPSSAPASYHLMVRDGPLAIPRVVANRREVQITAVEQGPEEYFLDVEANG